MDAAASTQTKTKILSLVQGFVDGLLRAIRASALDDLGEYFAPRAAQSKKPKRKPPTPRPSVTPKNEITITLSEETPPRFSLTLPSGETVIRSRKRDLVRWAKDRSIEVVDRTA